MNQKNYIMDNLRHNLRWDYLFNNKICNEEEYNPKIYLTTKNQAPTATTKLEKCMYNFKRELQNYLQYSIRNCKSNLSKTERKALNYIKKTKTS